MLNLEKVKLMTKLAMYESTEGKEDLSISRYYRSDYVGLALIKNFFIVSIGYVLLVGAAVAYYAEYLLDNLHKMNLVTLGKGFLIGYLLLLVFYSLLTYVQYMLKYWRAKKRVKDYYVNLSKLAQLYDREVHKGENREDVRRKLL